MSEQKHAPGSVKTFSCPKCGGSITIRALGITVTAVCASCNSVVDVSNPELRIVQAARNKMQIELDLPLGSRGTLFGTEWEVIGYMERGNLVCNWSEYLLFNPWQGFRFLVEDSGHWSFVRMLRENIVSMSRDAIRYHDETYKLFTAGSAKVTYVLGEFYWRVKVGEAVDTRDYIAPPHMLSKEVGDQEVTWSVGTYIDAHLVHDAFKITNTFPSPEGIAPHQECPGQKHLAKLWIGTAAAAVVLIVLGILLQGKSAVLVNQTISTTAAQKDTPIITDSVKVPYSSGSLVVAIASPVSNNWLEVDAELANMDTQEKDAVVEEVSYYHGIDTDGTYWSEGSQSTSDVLSAVPGGNYRLILTTDAGAFSQSQQSRYYQVAQPDNTVADPSRLPDTLSTKAQDLSALMLRRYNTASAQTDKDILNNADIALSHIRWEYVYDGLSRNTYADLLAQLETMVAQTVPAKNQETDWEQSVQSAITYNQSQRPSSSTEAISYQLKITRDTPVLANFLVALFFLLLWPLCVKFYVMRFEKRRWAESSFLLPQKCKDGKYDDLPPPPSGGISSEGAGDLLGVAAVGILEILGD